MDETYLTYMWCFTSMPHNMIHIMFLPRERFLANLTAMWCFTSVFSNMVHHMLFPTEVFTTILTLVRGLPGVTSENRYISHHSLTNQEMG